MSSSKPDKSIKSHRCRDEIKKDKALDAQRSKIINNVSNIAKATLEEPRLWARLEFSTLRDFTHAVTNNPSSFHTSDNMSSTMRANQKHAPLSSNFSPPLESRFF